MDLLSTMSGSKYPCIDGHLHVFDFIQNTSGLEDCLRYMDKANVRHATIFGLPVTKTWEFWEKDSPEYYLADDSKCYYYSAVDVFLALEYKALDEEGKGRFFPLVCGFNPCDKYGYRHIERIIKHFPGMWHGIGEVLCRHDDLTNQIFGDPPRCNHPGMDSVLDLAASLDMPVCIHQNITSVGSSTYPKWLHELDDMLQKHPKSKIVWAHCGVSRRVYSPHYCRIVRRVLDHYENLAVDFSWIVYDDFICPGGVPSDEWLSLAEDYSGRICIGSDLVNRFELLPMTIQRYDVFMDNLSEGARADLTFNTAHRLYGAVRG
jgi:hypothetical protein